MEFVIRIKSNYNPAFAKREIMPYEMAYQFENLYKNGGTHDSAIKQMGKGELALALSNTLLLYNAAREILKYSMSVDMHEWAYRDIVRDADGLQHEVMVFEYNYDFS